MWKRAFSERVNLTTEYKNDENDVLRQYDFGENDDIWVDFATVRPNPIDPVHSIHVQNTIDNATVVIFVDLILVDSIAPGTNLTFELDAGDHQVEFIPLRFNPYRVTVNVDGDMTWKIIHNAPLGSNDIRQTTEAGTGNLRIGGGTARFLNESYFELSTAEEGIQNTVTDLVTISNSASYRFNRESSLRMLTTYNKNDAVIDTISTQLTKSFMHQTDFRWGIRRRFNTGLTHAYTKTQSKTDVDDFNSTTNMFNNTNSLPIPRINCNVDWKNTATLLKDNRDYVNNQYVTDLTYRLISARRA